MLTVEIVMTFFMASVLLGLAPGPDNIFVLTQSTLHGRGAGLLVTLGLCTGLIVHSLAVAFGAAALFQSSELAFSALKFAGAAYLLYLAWGIFRAPITSVATSTVSGPGWTELYRRGIIMNITNPKVSIFFLAFLPQFADPARGSVALQIIGLGGLFILATLLVFGGIALAAGRLRIWLMQSERIQRWINRLAGAMFVGLALRLATSER